MNKLLIIFVLSIFMMPISWAQEGSYYTSKMAEYDKAKELFNKGKYADARYLFEEFLEYNKNAQKRLIIDAEYYRTLAAVKLYNRDAEHLLASFLRRFKESPRVYDMYRIMANYQYEKTKYTKALKWYKKIDPYYLTSEEKSEYYFKIAYSYLMRNKNEEANKFFKLSIADGSKYSVPAQYFYAHLSYLDKKYETALKEFKDLENDPLFAPIIPYYLIQIYYYQNDTEKIFEYAPSLLGADKKRRVVEISRILAEAYYQTNQFQKAFNYLDLYKKKSEYFSREDAFLMAFSLYKTEDYTLAIDYFNPLIQAKDSIAQNALYLQGDCYLKTNQKEKALIAFQSASKLTAVPLLQEDALYNYAKLSYELSGSAFNGAVSALTSYLDKYPNSEHKAEVYTYLSEVFLSTQNYPLAIKTLQVIEQRNPQLEESYQRVCYFRALEYFVDANYNQAIALFDSSMVHSKYNKKYRFLAKYWKAEAHYRLKNYAQAVKDYDGFLVTGGAFGSQEYKDAHYNLGYAYFKLQQYDKAIVWFRKFVEFVNSEDQMKISDAFNRIADCYFISKQYNFAVDYYKKVILKGKRNVDYALFQKGFSEGLLKKYGLEINTLNKIVQKYPQSVYVDDAIFEIGNAYKYLNQYNKAMNYYQYLINQYPRSEYASKSYLDLGMLEYNNDQDLDAIATFKELINRFPKSDEAQNALQIMKNIYVDINQVEDYIEFANQNNLETEVTVLEADSLTFISAENLYMNEKCEETILALEKYIKKYPKGENLLNANYYLADCAFKSKQYPLALQSYLYIVEQGTNEYTEEALLKAAYISNLDDNDELSISLYERLLQFTGRESAIKTANIALMRLYYKKELYQKAIMQAMKLLPSLEQNSNLEREVHYIIAQSFYAQGNYKAAYNEYQLISDKPKTKYGAEANYKMIDINYKNKNYEDAINIIKSFKQSHSPHQRWVAKSFMIWSDIFREQQDFLMAKATLESIINYYNKEDDGIKEEAQSKLFEIEELEREEQAVQDTLSAPYIINEQDSINESEELQEWEELEDDLELEEDVIDEEPILDLEGIKEKNPDSEKDSVSGKPSVLDVGNQEEEEPILDVSETEDTEEKEATSKENPLNNTKPNQKSENGDSLLDTAL